MQRRIPKFGFTNRNRVEYKAINLDTIQLMADEQKLTDFSPESLVAVGLAAKKDLIKILGRGELNATVNITAHAFSASAKEAIESKGGTVTVLA